MTHAVRKRLWFLMKLFSFLASIFSTNSPAAETKRVDPKSILFSTPTLNDALPALQKGTSPAGKLFQVHEDDWRQFEAVSATYRDQIDRELAAIRDVLATASVRTKAGDRELTAFRKVHVRKLITEPVKSGLLLSRIASFAINPTEYTGFSLSGSPPVLGGYALAIDGLVVFGQADGDRVLSLCFANDGAPKVEPARATKLVELLQEADLVVVHWPSATKIAPAEFLRYLLGGSPSRGYTESPRAGDAVNVAMALIRQHKFEEARKILLAAADKGEAESEALLGQIYNAGWGVQVDYEQAFKWWSRAASAGSTDALWGLGLLYDDGKGVGRDSAKAAELWRQGSERGNIKATVNLAFLYEEGRGVQRDLKEGARLFKIAAEAGEPGAQFNYALKLLRGEGVERDEIRGAAWLRIAAESPRLKGTAYAERLIAQRDRTWNDLSAADREKAMHLMREIQSKITDH